MHAGISLQVVMGEKGRSQLQRDMRESIYATIAGGCCFAAVDLHLRQLWQPQQ